MNEAGVQHDAQLGGVANFIDQMLADALDNGESLKQRLAILPKASIVKILTILDGKNGDSKADNLRKLLFKQPLDLMKVKENQQSLYKDAMASCTKFLLVSCYGGDDEGVISWAQLKTGVMICNTVLDKQAGALEATAAAAAMNIG